MSDHVSLKEYIEALLRAHDRRHEDIEDHRKELRDLLQTVVDELARVTEAWKATTNEWRATLNDVILTRPTREELNAIDAKFAAAVGVAMERIGEVRETLTLEEGAKSSGMNLRTTIFAGIASLGVIAAVTFGIIAAVGG